MSVYRFDSAWQLPGPVDRVWEAVTRVEDWPAWWPAVSATEELVPGAADGTGRVVRYLLRAPLGYRLAVTTRVVEVEPLHHVVVRVTGNLDGTGRWSLQPDGTGVRLHQLWEVSTTRPWMRLIAPLARPAFRWSHDRAARRGGEGLVRWLEGRR